jgi:signal transduction histidine kinase
MRTLLLNADLIEVGARPAALIVGIDATAQREAAQALAEAKEVADAANRAKSHFLANMSHELRTPLNAVIGYSEIIQDDFADGDTDECPAHARRIHGAAHHLLALINDVLDFSTIEVGKMRLKCEPLSAAEVARQALDVIAPLAASNRTSCELLASAEQHEVYADPRRLHQCLLNLLSNAAKFTHGGQISLRVRHVVISGRYMTAFDVRDTGPGMREETLVCLFQPFTQADQSATRRHQGAGLGLSITRRLARMMRGDVVVRSKLGQGSVFTLYLPCASSQGLERAAA